MYEKSQIEGGIVFNLLFFEQKLASCCHKIVLIKNQCKAVN